jgi:hypothetical protein
VSGALPDAGNPAAVEPIDTPETAKGRGVGAWSFVLGLLAVLIDIAFVVIVLVAILGVLGDVAGGDMPGVSTALAAAGFAVLAVVLFFGGFVGAGLAVLLGLIALFSGRGRVLGVFGVLFGAAALGVRLLLLGAGFSPEF